MKKKLLVLSLLSVCLLTGCKGKTYGDVVDWDMWNDSDNKIVFAASENGCYSDGSVQGDIMYHYWTMMYKNYEQEKENYEPNYNAD